MVSWVGIGLNKPNLDEANPEKGKGWDIKCAGTWKGKGNLLIKCARN